MNKIMSSIFGASWRTSLFGVIQLLAGTTVNYIQSLNGGVFSWTVFGMQAALAILSFLSKDGQVTGGSKPATPEAAVRVDSASKV